MKKENNLVKDALIGVGVVAIVAAAAGTYFLYGSKNAPKNRKKIKAWTLKAKGEVLEKLEKAKDMTEQTYHNIVDSVAKKYEVVKSVDKADVMEFASELKSHWKHIAKEIAAFHKKNHKK